MRVILADFNKKKYDFEIHFILDNHLFRYSLKAEGFSINSSFKEVLFQILYKLLVFPIF